MECMAMRQGYFRGFTAAEKTELWDRWQRGESLKAIGRAFGKPSSSIYFQLAPHGGIRPAPRRRSRLALTLAEREERARAIAEYQSTRSIAWLLGRSPSTVSREISRNGGYDGYRGLRLICGHFDRNFRRRGRNEIDQGKGNNGHDTDGCNQSFKQLPTTVSEHAGTAIYDDRID